MSNPTIFPALRYADAEAALEFLTKAFGFAEKVVHRGEDGTIEHAELRLGTSLVLLSGPRAEGWLGGGKPDPLASTISVYARVDDPQAHFDRARAEGATIVQELQTMDYGATEYSARDPEGNLWSFGTYDPYAG